VSSNFCRCQRRNSHGRRRNSSEAIAAHTEQIAIYEDLKLKLEVFLGKPLANVADEERAVNSALSIAEGVNDWWAKCHVAICNLGLECGLFIGMLGLCASMGADTTVSVVVLGALAGGKRVTDALKAFAAKGGKNRD
jgi:hypothetical protein